MKLANYAKLTALFSCFAFTAPAQADAVNVAVGLNGIALEYYLGLSPKLNARFVLSDMPIDVEKKDDDATIELKYDRTNFGMLFDFRPFSGTFHLTTGLYVGDHSIALNAAVKDNMEYDVGDETYFGDNLGIKSKINFAKAAPYFGLGWGNSTTSKGFTANFDIGVLYTGKISIDISASGQAAQQSASCTNAADPGCSFFNVAGDPLFQQELENERLDLEDKAKKVQLMPIMQFGLGYKF